MRAETRKYWMIYRGPGFLAVVWIGFSIPNPLPSASCPSFCLYLFRTGREKCANWQKVFKKLLQSSQKYWLFPKIRKKTFPDFGLGVKKAPDPESRSATRLEIVPDIDGILRNVVRHLLVFIHVARGNRQHWPIVREGQAETVATGNEHNLRRAVMKPNVKAPVPQLTLKGQKREMVFRLNPSHIV